MLKKLMISMVFLFAVSTLSYSQEKYAVSGEVKFPRREGAIILTLETQEEFEKGQPAPPERKLMIKPDAQQLKVKMIPFKFVDVPKGTYAISCIQDLNENGEMDHMQGVFSKIPTEPYGFSGTTLYGGNVIWSDVKFELDKEISGIEIELRSF